MLIGLTGSIGSGKTTVTDYFKAFHIEVYHADEISRELVEPGTPALKEIVKYFGTNMLLDDGSLNRLELRTHIFNQPEDRLWLENLLHPLISENLLKKYNISKSLYSIAEIPLLVDSKFIAKLDRVLTVEAPLVVQIARVCERDNSSPNNIRLILETQATREERVAIAHDIIENNGSLNNLKLRVTELHQMYLRHCNEDIFYS